ncbi:hypothetical protein FHL15_002745 [Xylaria flabelliformis]|uniref:phenylalanine--tRNA ligase n=1 Tax=Xylaria flabelliformis TaxID=2512241 RepID=A0A553I8E4_9PEZI|nr:hypothetical protein FHL15_002745 [Xylaria flabelliformis]
MATPAAERSDLASQLLHALDKEAPLLSAESFPDSNYTDLKAALDRLASRSMVQYEAIQREEVYLEAEGELIATHGSHEARVFEALRAAVDGLTIQELEKTIGDKNISKLGQGKAFRDKWITKTKDGKLKAVADSIHDAAREQLLSIQTSRTVSDPKALADLKKRKLVRVQKVIDFKINKGSEFALEIPEEATDLTAEMLATNAWKTATFKPYNFQALGAEQRSGALHPLNKFYTSDPMTADMPSDHTHWDDVKAVHQDGKYGSIGYRYPWSKDEALRLVLRTHTTSVSASILHKLAATKGPDGRPPPARYFSIDRVFRNETVDNTHLAEFHQVEGIIADYDLTLGGLMAMGITGLQYKPAYNPYTEPSMEIFAYHPGLGKIVEIGNSGMFRPEMLEAMGLPKDMRVYGWGLSLERPTMIRYGINNIRDLLGHRVDLSSVQRNPAVRLGKA